MQYRNALERFVRRDPLTATEVGTSLLVLVGTGVVVASIGRPTGAFDASGPAVEAVLVASVVLPALVAVDHLVSLVRLVRSGWDPDLGGLALAGYLVTRAAEACLAALALVAVGAGLSLVAASEPGPKAGGGILVGFLLAAVAVSIGLAAVVLVRVGGCAVRSV